MDFTRSRLHRRHSELKLPRLRPTNIIWRVFLLITTVWQQLLIQWWLYYKLTFRRYGGFPINLGVRIIVKSTWTNLLLLLFLLLYLLLFGLRSVTFQYDRYVTAVIALDDGADIVRGGVWNFQLLLFFVFFFAFVLEYGEFVFFLFGCEEDILQIYDVVRTRGLFYFSLWDRGFVSLLFLIRLWGICCVQFHVIRWWCLELLNCCYFNLLFLFRFFLLCCFFLILLNNLYRGFFILNQWFESIIIIYFCRNIFWKLIRIFRRFNIFHYGCRNLWFLDSFLIFQGLWRFLYRFYYRGWLNYFYRL